MEKAEKGEGTVPESNPVLDHLATFIVESFIRQDVNAFPESDLVHDLLVYKLKSVARPMMLNTVRKIRGELQRKGNLDVRQRVGGITQQKRVAFRTADQYNALVALFFGVVEAHPELVEHITDETSFENFMILCVNEYRDRWDQFVADIVDDRLALERKHQLYANRNRADAAWENVPDYADYIAERIDAMAAEPEHA